MTIWVELNKSEKDEYCMNSLTREILKTKQMNKHNNRNGVIDTKNE